MAWLEVETKVRVKNPKELRKKIRKIAKLAKIQQRGDDYFALKSKVYPKKAFRIRYDGEKFVVNFKKWLTKYWDKDIVVKREFEFRINDLQNVQHFLALLKDLGFVEWMKKIKKSESYLYKKDKRLVIEINKVKHLGYFMEIEYLCQEREMKKAKRIIRDVLKQLGIQKSDIDNTGYTKMLYKKGIKDRKQFLLK